MSNEDKTFITARGNSIDLAFDAKWHTIYPELWSINLESYVKNDPRFEYIKMTKKYVGNTIIDHYQVRIKNFSQYEEEKEMQKKYSGRECCLTAVTSNKEKIHPGDLEPHRSDRAVLIPERCGECVF